MDEPWTRRGNDKDDDLSTNSHVVECKLKEPPNSDGQLQIAIESLSNRDFSRAVD